MPPRVGRARLKRLTSSVTKGSRLSAQAAWPRVAALVAAIVLGACATQRPAAHSQLASRMQVELDRDAPLEVGPGSAPAIARQRHFIFIAGFLHETIPGYFVNNVAVVEQEIGTTATRLFPPSTGSLEADAELIRDAIADAYASNGKPIVLIGHSKGGAAAVLTALRYPDLVLSGKLDRVVAIQSPMRGSPVADSIFRWVPVNRRLLRWRGLETLTRQEAQRVFDTELSRFRASNPEEVKDEILRRIYFVRALQTRSFVSAELLFSHDLLSRHGAGDNDGLVLTEDMKLDDAGTDLGILRSDHGSLFVGPPLGSSTSSDRKAFTRALIATIF